MYIIILENSPRMLFSKNDNQEALNILKKIALFNGKLDEFEEKIKDKEFDKLLRKNKDRESIKIIEIKYKYSYSALFKYPSIRYKFLIFSFMFMSSNILANSIVINTKSMSGNMYLNIISLYLVEIIGSISSGFIINIPKLGRKKSILLFYLGIIFGFIIYLLFYNFEFSSWSLLGAMIIIRYSITGVFNTFYIFFMESYPTPLRSLGFGLNSTCGNIAGIIGPMMIEFISINILYPIFLFICLINCSLTYYLEETIGKPMKETIEEFDDFNEINSNKNKLIPEDDKDTNELDKE